ncbi:acyltransferase-like protein [Quercus suber]|uniref:Acyltransferase-like protein n=1 Tax=Quercus suber TaxID=58331 RepID=A0AAW0JIL7_QUESU
MNALFCSYAPVFPVLKDRLSWLNPKETRRVVSKPRLIQEKGRPVSTQIKNKMDEGGKRPRTTPWKEGGEKGIKALNQTHFSTSSHTSRSRENIVFVTIFTIYNSSLYANVNDRSSNLVTVGNASYSKVERSMAILNIFINFIKGEEYKLKWIEQSEFVRMAARFGAKIIPFGALVFDYDDQMKIPYFKDQIEKMTNDNIKLRTDATGEEFYQKFPGRFYYYFGKAIETEGLKQELKDRDKAHELYLQVKSEVGRCLAYLKEKRESNPYKNLLSRLIYQATRGFTSEIPTFKL